jgi:hypothetical protein
LDTITPPHLRPLLWTALVLAAIFLLSLDRLQPPAPKPANAPSDQFSAARAMEVLARLLLDGKPHPTGSAGNEQLRDRISSELTHLGYTPEIQSAFACDGYGTCANVHNIIARLEGAEQSSTVLLSAHYDSVPAGPGASDDGAGVAGVIEIARALKSIPRPRHSILILIDDGEEAGLLGARAFVNSSPWARNVRAAVNLDARGTSGSSLMFETGSANDWAVHLYATHATRPATSSIFYTAYKQLPNNTDFTVFKEAGYQGLNFAYVGNVFAYHTPLDNLANVNPGSLQQQGDNAFSSLIALANTEAELASPPRGESVFFDVLEHWTVRWPARWAIRLALFFDFMLLLQVAWLIWSGRVTRKDLRWGFCGWVFVIVGTGVFGYALLLLIRLAGAIPANSVAHSFPIEFAFWMLASAVLVNGAGYFVQRAGFWGLWCGLWTGWAALSFLVALLANGASYIFVLPSAIATLTALPGTFARENTPARGAAKFAGILPLIMAWTIGVAPMILLYDGLGIRVLPFIAVFVALLLTPVAPLCDQLRSVKVKGVAFPQLLVALTAIAAFVSVIVPPYSTKAPERVNIDYWKDADSGSSQWIVHPASGRLPDIMRIVAPFHSIDNGPFPWEHGTAFLSEAPDLKLAAPTFTIQDSAEDSGRQKYLALLRSERGAPDAIVLFPPDSDVRSLHINKQPMEPLSGAVLKYFDKWKVYRCVTMPAEGIQMSFTLPSGKPVELEVVDATYNFPAEGNFLLRARPLTAIPSQEGDITLVSRRVQLLP